VFKFERLDIRQVVPVGAQQRSRQLGLSRNKEFGGSNGPQKLPVLYRPSLGWTRAGLRLVITARGLKWAAIPRASKSPERSVITSLM
jgi:hypothetical protein